VQNGNEKRQKRGAGKSKKKVENFCPEVRRGILTGTAGVYRRVYVKNAQCCALLARSEQTGSPDNHPAFMSHEKSCRFFPYKDIDARAMRIKCKI